MAGGGGGCGVSITNFILRWVVINDGVLYGITAGKQYGLSLLSICVMWSYHGRLVTTDVG